MDKDFIDDKTSFIENNNNPLSTSNDFIRRDTGTAVEMEIGGRTMIQGEIGVEEQSAVFQAATAIIHYDPCQLRFKDPQLCDLVEKARTLLNLQFDLLIEKLKKRK